MTEREALKTEIESRMLSGEPFSYGTLCASFRAMHRRVFDQVQGDRLIDQTIQKLRKSGKIRGERHGRGFIWHAEEQADDQG